MVQFPFDLSGARILVTNDDGIHAPGLHLLAALARRFSRDVWVVAPEAEQSGAGHSLTLHQPLRVRKLGARRFAVSGTPTDCVLLAAREIIPRRKKVQLVLSGINRGSNIAEHVTYSGTIAAAMEGALLGLPSVAVSQATDEDGMADPRVAERFVPEILETLRGLRWEEGRLLSVNLPSLPVAQAKGVRLATQGMREAGGTLDKRIDPKGRAYYWIGAPRETPHGRPEEDFVLLGEGYVTVTPLSMDLTDRAMLRSMETLFKT